MLATLCEMRTMKPCAYAEIESWAKGAGRRGRQVSVPVLDVEAERGVLVFLAPLVLLVTLHLFLAQHRRREVLRERLSQRLGADALVLSDEPWLFTNLAVLSPGRWFAPNNARGVLIVFLLVGEAAAVAGMGAAIASISWDIVVDLGLSLAMEANPRSFADTGIDPDALARHPGARLGLALRLRGAGRARRGGGRRRCVPPVARPDTRTAAGNRLTLLPLVGAKRR
jgi:hypothetical protein